MNHLSFFDTNFKIFALDSYKYSVVCFSSLLDEYCSDEDGNAMLEKLRDR